MTRTSLLIMVAASALVCGTGLRGVLASQEASPAAGVVCVDVTTQPVDELVEQESVAFVTPAAAPAATTSVTSEADLPQGEPADAATAAAVDEVVQNWIACILIGEEAVVFALTSDDLDPALVLTIADSEEELRGYLEADLDATPNVGITETATTPGRDVRVLPNGRVGGIWAVDGDAAFVILEQEDGRWVIDELIDILEAATPEA